MWDVGVDVKQCNMKWLYHIKCESSLELHEWSQCPWPLVHGPLDLICHFSCCPVIPGSHCLLILLTLPQAMGDLKALASINSRLNKCWLAMWSFGWEGVWPKERAWENSHEKAFDGSGGGHLFPDLLSFDPSSTRLGCFKEEMVLFVFVMFAQSQAHTSSLITAFWLNEWDRVMWLTAHGTENKRNRTWNPGPTIFFWPIFSVCLLCTRQVLSESELQKWISKFTV